MNEITSTHDLAEGTFDGCEEPCAPDTDMVATVEPVDRGIEFHVSMRDYTLRDMEALIVDAAARQILGKSNDRVIAKEIEGRCLALLTEKADKALANVTAEIIDQPLTPTFAFGDKKPITMREFLGLYGREYLTQRVGHGGEISTSSYDKTTRMQWLVQRHMDAAFKKEIQAATSEAIREVTAALKAEHAAVLGAEMKRFRDALAKATNAPAI